MKNKKELKREIEKPKVVKSFKNQNQKGLEEKTKNQEQQHQQQQ
tara:strand:+ start:6371 stop:6502 length:132 start_codon:yes stop_codon:yes gene_type:complete